MKAMKWKNILNILFNGFLPRTQYFNISQARTNFRYFVRKHYTLLLAFGSLIALATRTFFGYASNDDEEMTIFQKSFYK